MQRSVTLLGEDFMTLMLWAKRYGLCILYLGVVGRTHNYIVVCVVVLPRYTVQVC